MKWKRFLEDVRQATLMTLVGPLYGKIHIPTTPTVYVDGGAHFRPDVEIDNFPVISVGDGDSSQIPLDKVLPVEKDYSDTAFVLRQLPDTINHVEMLGFLGESRDHELLTIGEIHHFLNGAKRFRSARFDDLIVGFAGGQLSLEINGRFSIIVFEPAMITLGGACKYPIAEPSVFREVSSHGLGNFGFGTVLVECSVPCFIYLT